MKTLMIASVVMGCCATGLWATEPQAGSPAVDPLVVQYDLNGNGKIDVFECKPYVQERARRQREDAKRLAAVFTNASPEVLRQVKPPDWTKDNEAARLDQGQ